MTSARTWAAVVFLAACVGTDPTDDKDPDTEVPVESDPPVVDADGDGFASDVDCDDDNASVNPEAAEICNGIDDDCDGRTDSATHAIAGAEGPVWADADGDGYGRDESDRWFCELPSKGWIGRDGDCNDQSADALPGGREVCDGVDNDCDGAVDDADDDVDTSGPGGGVLLWVDGDGDGVGSGSPQGLCTDPGTGYATSGGDCDDGDPSRFPGNHEVCNGIDDDCDGLPDALDGSVDPAQVALYGRDDDGDGFGSPAGARLACLSAPPSGYVANTADCDDTEEERFPGNPEVCDELDNDCNFLTDDDDPDLDLTTLITFWEDLDGDGFGTTDGSIEACAPPEGYAVTSDDCLDEGDRDDVPAAEIFPTAEEICNGIDDDCDSRIDDADTDTVAEDVYFLDRDVDGFGDPASGQSWCIQPEGTVTNDEDCDDADDHTFPGAAVLEPETACHRDADEDGWGDLLATGDVVAGSDCDDGEPLTSPSAAVLEAFARCLAHQDEDGWGDENATSPIDPGSDCDDTRSTTAPGAAPFDDLVACLADFDGDNWGSDAPPAGVVAGTDCNDVRADVNPAATEVWYDGLDQNCDRTNDHDQDGDGETRLASGGLDCDDTNPDRFSTNPEVAYDGVDQDCTGADLCDVDLDGENAVACPGGTDCDDDDPTRFAANPEVCNDRNDNCDTLADEGLPTFDWYTDYDRDGFGRIGEVPTPDCNAPGPGWSTTSGDCVDGNAAVNPAATEICNDIDDDCDDGIDEDFATTTWYADTDADGFGDPWEPYDTCLANPAGHVLNPDDCDDTEGVSFPGNPELCDAIDNDCDGVIDNGLALTTYYRDVDGDGYGDPLRSVDACTAPAGYVANHEDCNDGSTLFKPGATERCNGLDDDCDGVIDNGQNVQNWELDEDGDGFGQAGVFVQGCDQPPNGVPIATPDDCDDADPTVFPGADDPACDGIDQDCGGDGIPEYVIPDDVAGANAAHNAAVAANQPEIAVCYRPGTWGSAATPSSVNRIVEVVGLGDEPDDTVIVQPAGVALYVVDDMIYRNLKISASASAPLGTPPNPGGANYALALFDRVHVVWDPTEVDRTTCDGLITIGWVTAHQSVFEGLHVRCTTALRFVTRPPDFDDVVLRNMVLSTTSTTRSFGLFGGQDPLSGRSQPEVRGLLLDDLQVGFGGNVDGALITTNGGAILEDITLRDVAVSSPFTLAGLINFDAHTGNRFARWRFRGVDLNAKTLSGGLIAGGSDPDYFCGACAVATDLIGLDVAGVRITAEGGRGGVLRFAGTRSASSALSIRIAQATLAGVVVSSPSAQGVLIVDQGAPYSQSTLSHSIVAWTRAPAGSTLLAGLIGGVPLAVYDNQPAQYGALVRGDPRFVDVRLTPSDDDITFDDPGSWDLSLLPGGPYVDLLDPLYDPLDVDGSAGDFGAYGGPVTSSVSDPWFDWPLP